MYGESLLLAEGHLDLDEFFDELKVLLDRVWGTGWGVFAEAEANVDDPVQLSTPRIHWEVVRREPDRNLSPKPKLYQELPDPEYEGHSVQLYRQWFTAEVRFICMDSNRRGARRIAQRLEEVLLLFTGHFRRLGITDLFLDYERSEPIEGAPRQPVARQVLGYRVRYERIIPLRTKALEQLAIRAKLAGEDGSEISTVVQGNRPTGTFDNPFRQEGSD